MRDNFAPHTPTIYDPFPLQTNKTIHFFCFYFLQVGKRSNDHYFHPIILQPESCPLSL